MPARRLPARSRYAGYAAWAGAVILLTAGAQAMAALVSESALSIGVRGAPVQFEAGAGGQNPRYVNGLEFNGGLTAFSATVKAKAGADATVKDVVRLTGADGSAHTVTLTGTNVTNAHVERFTWTVRNATGTVAQLDHLASSPAVTFAIGAGETLRLDLRVDLADGAGRNNAGLEFDLRVDVT